MALGSNNMTIVSKTPQDKKPHTFRACRTCRARKVKCDIVNNGPCTPCSKSGRQCIPTIISTSTTNTSRPPESIVENVEGFKELKTKYEIKTDLVNRIKKSLSQLNKILESDQSMDHLDGISQEYRSSGNYLSVVGPMRSKVDDVNLIRKLNQDPSITKSLKLFFKHLYPDIHVFVHREAILIDFYDPKLKSAFVTPELIYAIAALGSKIDSTLSGYSHGYYNKSHQLVSSKLALPSITSVQTFLLLGLYSTYQGEKEIGWMLTGNGIRMSVSLGNDDAFRDEADEAAEVAVRNRLLYGTYFADHVASFLSGRPSFLAKIQLEIEETQYIPEFKSISEFTFPRDVSTPTTIIDSLKEIIKLVGIGEKVINDVFSSTSEIKFSEKQKTIDHYNKKLLKWRCRFFEETDQHLLNETPILNTRIFVYYIIVLSLNRPFVKKSTVSNDLAIEVIGNIQNYIKKFTEKNEYSKVSPLVIYSVIISVSTLLYIDNFVYFNEDLQDYFFDLLQLLKNSGQTWILSKRAFETFDESLSKQGFKFINEIKNYENNTLDKDSLIGVDRDAGDDDEESTLDEILITESFGGPPLFMSLDNLDYWEDLLKTE